MIRGVASVGVMALAACAQAPSTASAPRQPVAANMTLDEFFDAYDKYCRIPAEKGLRFVVGDLEAPSKADVIAMTGSEKKWTGYKRLVRGENDPLVNVQYDDENSCTVKSRNFLIEEFSTAVHSRYGVEMKEDKAYNFELRFNLSKDGTPTHSKAFSFDRDRNLVTANASN